MTAPYTVTPVTMTGLDGLPHPVATGVMSVSGGLVPQGAQFALMALLDSTGTPLDPATAENQAAILAAIAALTSQDAGLATAAAQTAGNANIALTAVAAGSPGDGVYAGSGATTIVGALKGIFARLAASIAVTGTFWQATQPVSAASLPLPTGAAQETGGNLAAILTKLNAVVLGVGAAIIGKVGIDQSTPGTTNGVVVNNGSTGHDFSANIPTLPNIGANFAAGGPYSSYVLIATVPASATRANVDIENTSGGQIAIIRDDGTAASAAAPANASVFALQGGGAAGQQGGSWSSSTFKGRLQIYAASSAAQVAVMVE